MAAASIAIARRLSLCWDESNFCRQKGTVVRRKWHTLCWFRWIKDLPGIREQVVTHEDRYFSYYFIESAEQRCDGFRSFGGTYNIRAEKTRQVSTFRATIKDPREGRT